VGEVILHKISKKKSWDREALVETATFEQRNQAWASKYWSWREAILLVLAAGLRAGGEALLEERAPLLSQL